MTQIHSASPTSIEPSRLCPIVEPLPEFSAMPATHTLSSQWPVVEPPAAFMSWISCHTREAVAFHEAGHAVLLQVIGVTPTRAATCDDGVVAGRTKFVHPTCSDIPRSEAERKFGCIFAAAAAHAGMEAEILRSGCVPPYGVGWHFLHDSDIAVAEGVLGMAFQSPPHGYSKAVARAILCQNWWAVEHIAVRILLHGEWTPGKTPGLRIGGIGENGLTVLRACLDLETAQQDLAQKAA